MIGRLFGQSVNQSISQPVFSITYILKEEERIRKYCLAFILYEEGAFEQIFTKSSSDVCSFDHQLQVGWLQRYDDTQSPKNESVIFGKVGGVYLIGIKQSVSQSVSK